MSEGSAVSSLPATQLASLIFAIIKKGFRDLGFEDLGFRICGFKGFRDGGFRVC